MKLFDYYHKAVNKIRKKLYKKYFKKNIVKNHSQRIVNKECSIISNNCYGGMLYNSFSGQFLSPTINLAIHAEDYIKFLENLKYYLQVEPKDISTDNKVVALIDDVKIHALHYDTFEQFKTKWVERSKRVNFDNLYVIGGYIDHCTDEIVRRFNDLPYKNKVFLSHKPFPEYDCVKHIPCPRRFKQLPPADGMYNSKISYYDKYFDFISWLNQR